MIAEATIPMTHRNADPLRDAISKRLTKEPLKVPMMPQVASKVMTLTSDPDVELSDLSNLIHRDPALAARVLQIANSAAYRGSEEIDSLQGAVQRLGMRTLSEIIFSVSLRVGVFRVPGFDAEVNQLWQHALFSGYFAKEIAHLRGISGESLFLCGLLHTIGKLPVFQLMASLAQQLKFVIKPETIEALLEEFHEEVSAHMAREWKLPQMVQIACSNYKNYTEAPACVEEAATTYLADLLAKRVVWPERVDELALPQDPVFEALHLDSGTIETVLNLRESVEAQVAALAG